MGMLKLVYLNEIYIAELHETPHANPKHNSSKLKAKLEKKFSNKIAFCKVDKGGGYNISYTFTLELETATDNALDALLLGCLGK